MHGVAAQQFDKRVLFDGHFGQFLRSQEERNVYRVCLVIDILPICLFTALFAFIVLVTRQTFCPSILFQFGELGLTEPSVTNHASTNNNKTVYFRQIYSILIQLTALIGGCNSMISVFEAVYQRILTYPPENDRAHILKLFKNVKINKRKIIFSINWPK